MMKQGNQLPVLVLWAGFIAATLQGSRLPDAPIRADEQTAQAADTVEYRAGSGSDKEEYPPRAEGTYT